MPTTKKQLFIVRFLCLSLFRCSEAYQFFPELGNARPYTPLEAGRKSVSRDSNCRKLSCVQEFYNRATTYRFFLFFTFDDDKDGKHYVVVSRYILVREEHVYVRIKFDRKYVFEEYIIEII